MNLVRTNKDDDWLDWLRRVMAGDADAETELVERYKDGIAIIIGRVVRNDAVTDDLSQETFRIVLEKIRRGEVRDPERLSGFICSVAENLALDYVRRLRRKVNQEEIGEAEQIRDPRADQFAALLQKERGAIVRQVIDELKVERDREVLFRYYIAEEDKERICADLKLSSRQFNSVRFRALNRYRELYIKRFGEP
ncbi:MAG TPA: sigma-70 family RNA polymerase sigma factor [Blastocatellia bacterium]|nr:sigma-70 family RNA polymerase sigma factor [Blastocatellia bacterium]